MVITECPKCGRNFTKLLALSRTDNKTMVCDKCGIMEALDSLAFHKKQKKTTTKWNRKTYQE